MQDQMRKSDVGQALVVLVFAMVGLLVAVGLAIDGGGTYLYRRRAQNAADAAAREGARQLYDWQVHVAYADNSAETEILKAVHQMAEANGIPDTDGTRGNEVNENVSAYYADILGERITNIPIGEAGSLAICLNKKCGPEGVDRCCGVEVEVQNEFDTSLIRLAGPSSVPVEAKAAGVFVVSQGLGGLGDSALFALGCGCGQDQLTLTGDHCRIIGTAHTNDGTIISLDDPHIDKLEYVDAADVHISADDPDIGEEVDLDAPVDPNLPFTTAFYADYSSLNGTTHTGDWSINSDTSGLYHVNGDLDVGENVDLSGMFYVDGDVRVHGDNVTLLETTLVATGKITVTSDSVPFSPWPHPASHPWGIALYSDYDATDKCSNHDAGIMIDGDDPNDRGIVYAPKSRIRLNANPGYMKGTFIGWSIDVHGDSWTFEKWRPDGGSVGQLERITLVR